LLPSRDNNGNGILLGFRRDEVAEVIPPSPPIPKKKKPRVLERATTPEFSTPKIDPIPFNTPLISPSPCGEAKIAWDDFISNLSRGLPRVPSLESFSVDVVGSPFEARDDDDCIQERKDPPREIYLEANNILNRTLSVPLPPLPPLDDPLEGMAG
jgi:hypothetical protein